MNALESNLLITLAMVIMIVLNLLFGFFSFYMIKEYETTLQRLLNTLYLLLAFVIQVSLLNRNCLIRIQATTNEYFSFSLDLCSIP